MKTVISILCTLFVVFIILAFMKMTTTLPNEHKNGFVRNMTQKEAQLIESYKFDIQIEKICGATDHNIYLRLPNPQWIIQKSIYTPRIDTIYFPVKPSKDMLLANTFIIDSPKIVFYANNIPAIFYGVLSRNKVDSMRLLFLKALFTRSLFIGKSTSVLRYFDSSQNQQILTKIDIRTGKSVKSYNRIMDNNRGFSSDGSLVFDPVSSSILFVSFYKNSFICLDTNLNEKYHSRTIDTVRTSISEFNDISTGELDGIAPSNSRLFVNKDVVADGGFLYVHSTLKGDNEISKYFRANDVIDIYRIENGSYISSFYVPRNGNHPIKSLYIKQNKLYVIKENTLAIYKIPY